MSAAAESPKNRHTDHDAAAAAAAVGEGNREPPSARAHLRPFDGLAHAAAAALSAEGPLAQASSGHRERSGQLAMTRAVADAIEASTALVVEAGTGIGKTFAYLVPVLLSGQRALISTATKNLQDQLYARDLPRLIELLRAPASTALLKGRGSYLCLHRLEQAEHDPAMAGAHLQRALARVQLWAQGTRSGDVSELDGMESHPALAAAITSTRENCLGSECPKWQDCHVMRARRDAMAADVVVINHHVYFADVMLKDAGVAELLPQVDVRVFDEAHQLIDAGIQFLGQSVSSGQVFDFSRDLLATCLAQAQGVADWQALAAACEHAARQLRLAAGGAPKPWERSAVDGRAEAFGTELPGAATGPLRPGTSKRAWEEVAAAPGFAAGLQQLQAAFSGARDALAGVEGASADLARLYARAQAWCERVAAFGEAAKPERVRWVEAGSHHLRLVDAPLDIAAPLTHVRERAGGAWIFTSATLGDDEPLSWFTEAAGLQGANRLRIASPFDYMRNARVYVPPRFPEPQDAAHLPAFARAAAHCAQHLKGRTFALTTTLRALDIVAREASEALTKAGEAGVTGAEGIRVLVQGQASKRSLMEAFLRGNALLIASHSFWEGVDVPGDALQCVLIDKLPFPPPNDPWVQARSRLLKAQGRDPFDALFVAQAAIALKQGAGRLIRTETDRGLLLIADKRLLGQRYGARLLAALPPMPLLADSRQAQDWLLALAAGEPKGGA